MAGEHLDLSSDPDDGRDGTSPARRRDFLGGHFVCCDVYARAYLNRDRTGYEGRCPRCYRVVRFRIGPDGSDARFYRAY